MLMMSLAVLLLPSTGFLRPQRSLQVFGPVALEAKKSWKNRAAKKAGLSAASVKPATIDGKAVTSLDLMVRPNPPRFLREGDALEFTTRVINTGETVRVGSVKLNLQNAETEASVNALLGNTSPEQKFAIPAGESRSFSWRLTVPDGAPTAEEQWAWPQLPNVWTSSPSGASSRNHRFTVDSRTSLAKKLGNVGPRSVYANAEEALPPAQPE